MSDRVLDRAFKTMERCGTGMDIEMRLVLAVLAMHCDDDSVFEEVEDPPLITNNPALRWAVESDIDDGAARLALFFIAHKAKSLESGLPVYGPGMTRKLSRICMATKSEVKGIVGDLIRQGAVMGAPLP